MITFKRKVALKITMVSLALASIASPLAWYISHLNAEKAIVAFAMEESHRVLMHRRNSHGISMDAEKTATTLTGGLFEIAEIYDSNGVKLAKAMTTEGQLLEQEIHHHHTPPSYHASLYESFNLSENRWVLQVFTPLREENGNLAGYFEGTRLVPVWQKKQILVDSLTAALMVGLASLLCGAVLFPVVIRLSSENQRKAQELLESHISMMEALGCAIAKRDSTTGAHNYRVAWASSILAETLGIKGGRMQALIAGSFLHDTGKIGIPDAILLKPAKLTADEMKIMRTHVTIGEEIITGSGWLDGAREVVAGHHEKWDGSGYPRGLAGEAIPFLARIFAIVDVFDALCSKRPYKNPLPLNEVMDILQKGSGIHFDPKLLTVFSNIASKVYKTTVHASEAEMRALMKKMVQRHFGNY
ncbi:HD-GYP domain-containing protein [Candidatus Nitrotoga sp. HW29]|uniref:HD-GYP domain-containing protein n=1 Tax=Candidatus Nitrotoga sp. HW29 TaxID=2886963 RepID=UPI001EF1B0ED|nr:HD domain-containing phosphohydrolase [Candidatus Nitrotoga sp. HW29]CAH1904909.1 HD-GYP domain-containing protein [Candidatus Nitrotoga sp. HW29]